MAAIREPSPLAEFVRRFRLARNLGRELDAAMEDAFRARVCDCLTARLFDDKCPKMRRELLGRLLDVDKGTRSRWLHGMTPSYENVFLGLLSRRSLFRKEAAGEGVQIISEATAAALAVARCAIDDGSFEPPDGELVRLLHRLMQRTRSIIENEKSRNGSANELLDVAASKPLDEHERRILRQWLLPLFVFHDATGYLWRLGDEQ